MGIDGTRAYQQPTTLASRGRSFLYLAATLLAASCSSGSSASTPEATTQSTEAASAPSTRPTPLPTTEPVVPESTTTPPAREAVELPETVAQFPAGLRAISPVGDLFFARLHEGDCIVRVDDGTVLGCLADDNPERVKALKFETPRFQGTSFVWSDDGSSIAFTPGGVDQISLIDLGTGEIRWVVDPERRLELDDDGSSTKPTDLDPAWLAPNESLIFQSQVGSHYTIQIADLAARSITKTIELPTRTNLLGREVRQTNPGTPLVVSETSVFLAGDGALFELDPTAPNPHFVEVVDFSASYAGAGTNVVPAGDLLPIAQLSDNIMLMSDKIMGQTFSRDRGVTSGAYLLDMTTGSLNPLFQKSTDDDPWFGPTRIWVSPDRNRLVVSWNDPSIIHPTSGYRLENLSMLDLRSATLPVNPRDLPLVWGSGTEFSNITSYAGISRAGTWTAQDTIAFNTSNGQTIVISVKDNP